MSASVSLLPLKMERVAPGVHRIEVACPLLGLAPPPIPIDLHVHRNAGLWAVRASGGDVDTIRAWLSSVLGVQAARVQRAGGLRVLAGVTRAPPQRLVQAMARGRMEQVRVSRTAPRSSCTARRRPSRPWRRSCARAPPPLRARS